MFGSKEKEDLILKRLELLEKRFAERACMDSQSFVKNKGYRDGTILEVTGDFEWDKYVLPDSRVLVYVFGGHLYKMFLRGSDYREQVIANITGHRVVYTPKNP